MKKILDKTVYCLTIFVLIILFLVFLSLYKTNVNIDTIAILVCVSSIFCLINVFCNDNIKKGGLFFVIFLYTLLVHNGFVIANFLDSSYNSFQSITSMSFLQNDFYREAIIISNLVILSMVISSNFKVNNRRSVQSRSLKPDYKGNKTVDGICLSVLLVGFIYLLYISINYGLFFGSYSYVLSVTENMRIYHHLTVLVSLCVAFLFSVGTRKGIIIGSILFGMIALIHFSIGNRGEALYAAVVCFALYQLRFNIIKLRHIMLILALGMMVIPLVRILRSGQISLYSFNPISSILDTFAEIGIQISPVTYIVEFVEKGNSNVFGMTYVYSFFTFLSNRFFAKNMLNASLYNIKEIMPYEGMGFSMIGESFYNFGLIGAIIIYFLYGLFLKKTDYSISNNLISENKRILISMFMVELVNLTRNDSSTIPLYLAYSILILLFYRVLYSSVKKADYRFSMSGIKNE